MTRRAGLETRLKNVARKVLKRLRRSGAHVDIFLLEEKALSRLKARFGLKKKGQRPDVLAFPEEDSFPHPEKKKQGFLGEIYLNRDLEDEGEERLVFLLIHGILHLAGFSHDGKNDILKMQKQEKRLMRLMTHDKRQLSRKS